MFTAVVRKFLLTIPLLLIVSIIMFSVIYMLPGNAATLILSDGGSVSQMEQLEEKLGLDQPLHIQYFNWLKNFTQGEMGTSYLTGQPVERRIGERLPVTLELILFSMTLAIIIGIPIGILCAIKRNSIADYMLSTISMIGVAMPAFWLGILLILLFSVKLSLLPASGFVRFSLDPAKNIRTMIMPSVTLALSLAAPIIRQTRSAMLDTLSQDYVLTARAKGLSKSKIIFKHALRNALVPVATSISSQIGSMVGGVFVIETLFLLPGMGKSMVDAIYQRDYPIVMAIAMVVISFIVLINLVTDVIYIVIDPRISSEQKQ